jgi:hypothetical protein
MEYLDPANGFIGFDDAWYALHERSRGEAADILVGRWACAFPYCV